MYNIRIYKNRKGKSEISDYITNLRETKSKSNNIKFTKIVSYIRMLKENGLLLGEPYIKHQKRK